MKVGTSGLLNCLQEFAEKGQQA